MQFLPPPPPPRPLPLLPFLCSADWDILCSGSSPITLNFIFKDVQDFNLGALCKCKHPQAGLAGSLPGGHSPITLTGVLVVPLNLRLNLWIGPLRLLKPKMTAARVVSVSSVTILSKSP